VAGVAGMGLGAQLALIASLRWRLFRNSMRTKSARLELLAYILASVLGSLFAVGVGLGLGIGAYFLASRGKFLLLGAIFWAVFLVWQFMPLMVAASGAGFDFRNFLRFPLRFSAFYVFSLGYGLADPAAATALLWLLCVSAGITLSRVQLFLPVLLLALCFALMNLLLSRMVFTWLERLLARRRTREAVVAIFLLCMILLQFSGPFLERYGRQTTPLVIELGPLLRWLPPGLPGRALEGIAQGDFVSFFTSVAGLLAYAAFFGWLLRMRLHAQYLGEDFGETQAGGVAAASSRKLAAAHVVVSARAAAGAPPSFLDRLIPVAALAVAKKEIRYLLRNTVMLLNLALPVILVAFFTITWSSSRGPTKSLMVQRIPDLAFPGAIAYMSLILSQFALNAFAYDGRGVQVYYLAPVRFRDFLLGKNITLALQLALDTVLLWILISVLKHPPGLVYVLGTLAWLAFSVLAHFIVGNWLSLQYPRKLVPGQFRGRASGMSVLIGLGLQITVLGLGILVGFIALFLGRLWVFPLIFVILGALAFWLYMVSLDRYSYFAVRHREELIEKLAR
jgi:ABC-2 type transport system permease protein